jgi:hypothetical protein
MSNNNIVISGKMSKVSEKATKEVIEQAKTKGFDLIHQLVLCDITVTSDGFFLQRDEGDIGYNRFLGKPSLSGTVLGRMDDEILALSKDTQTEVWNALGSKYPSVWKALVRFRQENSDVDVDGYIGY